MTYAEAVRSLYALGNEVHTAKLGLERIRKLLGGLGDPQQSCRWVHVAGTNGKGSVSAMIEAGLRAAGVRTGLYTSPHLVEPRERIQIAGRPVSPDEFAGAFERVHETAERMLAAGEIDLHPTYFESVTAMGFVLFREHNVDTAVLEVGLGGRLDATNVVTPELCVITPVDYDHPTFLGDTVEQIAAEKAGILKPGVPAVLARQRPEAARVIEDRAIELRVPFERAVDAGVSDARLTERGGSFILAGQYVQCPLAGEHQVDNAITAALALRRLGYPANGIAATRWPGRLEFVSAKPDIILDGAHNVAGTLALAAYIRRFHAGRKIWLIYGAVRDKAVQEMAAELFPLAACIVVTAPANSRAMPPSDVAACAPSRPDIRTTPDISAALGMVRSEAAAEDVILIAGSLYLVGEARRLLVK